MSALVMMPTKEEFEKIENLLDVNLEAQACYSCGELFSRHLLCDLHNCYVVCAKCGIPPLILRGE